MSPHSSPAPAPAPAPGPGAPAPEAPAHRDAVGCPGCGLPVSVVDDRLPSCYCDGPNESADQAALVEPTGEAVGRPDHDEGAISHPAPRPDISTSTSVHHVDPIHDVKVIRIAPRHVVVYIGPVTFHFDSLADVSVLTDSLHQKILP